jgi:hypothetical protein
MPFLRPRQVIGVITFDADRLNTKHFSGLGTSCEKIDIIGCPPNGVLRGVIWDGRPYDYEALEQDIVDCAKHLILQNPNVGAIVLECTQLAVFAIAIQEAVRLPVYDALTMGSWFYFGLVRNFLLGLRKT